MIQTSSIPPLPSGRPLGTGPLPVQKPVLRIFALEKGGHLGTSMFFSSTFRYTMISARIPVPMDRQKQPISAGPKNCWAFRNRFHNRNNMPHHRVSPGWERRNRRKEYLNHEITQLF